jgi:hypothetical protein
LMFMFGPSPVESPIVTQKFNHIPLSGTHATVKCLNVPLCERMQPGPRPAQSIAAAGNHIFNGKFAGKKRLGERRDKRRIQHEIKAAECSNESDPA